MQFTLRVLQRRSHQGVLWPILETPLHAETALNLRIGPPLILDYPRFGSCARLEPQQGLSSAVIPDRCTVCSGQLSSSHGTKHNLGHPTYRLSSGTCCRKPVGRSNGHKDVEALWI